MKQYQPRVGDVLDVGAMDGIQGRIEVVEVTDTYFVTAFYPHGAELPTHKSQPIQIEGMMLQPIRRANHAAK